jgi:hypothetical protein
VPGSSSIVNAIEALLVQSFASKAVDPLDPLVRLGIRIRTAANFPAIAIITPAGTVTVL